MLRHRSRPWPFALAVCLVACGGSTTPSESATPATKVAAERDATPPAPARDDEDRTTPAEPKHATCDDGTCAPCGDAFCPTGWYCDESARGGPACGWLPECAKTSGCACVKKAFAGCTCEEQGGAAHLSCR
ncbi:MAG TPA: hypothetical protein VMI54_08640 [Polyangiaceae bacterium]|nr:hypothetical protein [Polyangiaceae bacterium]